MSETRHEPRYFVRLTLSERIQHGLIIGSFLALVLTGFPLRFASNPAAQAVVRFLGGYENRALIHRGAAGLMMAVALYHFGSMIVGSWRNRQNIRRYGLYALPMVWTVKDWEDLRQTIVYYTRMESEPPKYGRYSYVEKVEYWSLLWGVVIMSLSGLILWFPFDSLSVLPKSSIIVAQIVHSYEAALAVSAIVIWHFYTVHFSPDHFPMNWAWITGKVSAEELKEHHPLEYERLMREYRARRRESQAD